MRKGTKQRMCMILTVMLIMTLPLTTFAESDMNAVEQVISAQEPVSPQLPEEQPVNPEEPETPDSGTGSDLPDPEQPSEPDQPGTPEQPVSPEPKPEQPAGTKLLNRPSIKLFRVADTGKTKISWEKIKGADKYRVYCASNSDGPYERIATTSKLSYIHSKGVASKRYYYKVQAISNSKPETNSKKSLWKSKVCDYKRPVCTVDLDKSGKPKLTWKKIKYADMYQIYRSLEKNGTYKKIATVKGTTYTHKKAYYHKTYYYKIVAIDAKVKDADSAKSKACSIYTIDLRKKLVALTFDDGPGPYTKAIVNCLKKNNARATFYVQGYRVESYPGAVQAIHAGRNEIGNHTYNHPMLYELNASQIRWQMNTTDDLVKDITGVKPKTMRPPGGGVNDLVRETVGKPMIFWSIDTRDWEHRNVQMTIDAVMENVSDGDIVLMHDIHKPTKEAALKLIPKLRKAGYELVTVSELSKYKGVKLKNGKSYYCF